MNRIRKAGIVFLSLLLLLTACKKEESPVAETQTVPETEAAVTIEETKAPETTAPETEAPETTAPETTVPETTEIPSGEPETEEAGARIFEELDGTRFVFTSGVGAWDTELTLQADGTFEGLFHDSDMGVTGEGYPNGTVYTSAFRGQFSEPVEAEEGRWKTEVISLFSTADGDVDEEISPEDGIRYIYTTPYGVGLSDSFVFYPAATLLSDLSEDIFSWLWWRYPEGAETLGAVLLYNETAEAPFYPDVYSESEGAVSLVVRDRMEAEYKTEDGSTEGYKVTFSGLDAGGNEVWSYESGPNPLTELVCAEVIGISDGIAYLTDNGKVVALDTVTGEKRWETENVRVPSCSYDFDADGNLYICGYYGGYLYKIDRTGNVLFEASFGDCYWPYEVLCNGSSVKVSFEGEPAGELVFDAESGEPL